MGYEDRWIDIITNIEEPKMKNSVLVKRTHITSANMCSVQIPKLEKRGIVKITKIGRDKYIYLTPNGILIKHHLLKIKELMGGV